MSPMKRLFKVGKYSFSYAGERFMYKGLWFWTGKKNVRIIPLNRFDNWTGKVVD